MTSDIHQFERFRSWVLQDPQRMARFRGLGREEFVDAALKVAAEAGIPLLRSDVQAAIDQAHQERIRRIV